jgi:hypothetical protein
MRSRREPIKFRPMIALLPQMAFLALITTGVGFLMIRLGLSKGLEARHEQRRCPACGRLVQASTCSNCRP